ELADAARVEVGRGLLEHVAQEPLAEVARLLELLPVDRGDELLIVGMCLAPTEESLGHAVQTLRDGTLLRSACGVELLAQGHECLADLESRARDEFELARRQ